MIAAGEIVMNHAEIVDADMRELRAAGHFADGPHAGRGRLQAFVDLDISTVSERDARGFEPEPRGVRSAARRDEQVSAFDGLLRTFLGESNRDRLTRLSRDPGDFGAEYQVDSLVFEEFAEGLREVIVFAKQETVVTFDYGYFAAEPTHRLGEFDADVAATENQEMFGDFIELKRFDMRQRARVDQAWNRVQRSARPGADDHVRSAEQAACTIAQGCLYRSRRDEAPRRENQFRARLLVVVEVEIVQPRNHLAFAVAHHRDIHSEVFFGDAEGFAVANVGGHPGAV